MVPAPEPSVPPDLSTRFGYRAFGLYLSSNMPLPGLVPVPNPGMPVVPLELGSEPPGFSEDQYRHIWYKSRSVDQAGVPALVIRTSGDFAVGRPDLSCLLSYSDGTRVYASPGATKLWVTWQPASCIEEVCTYLLGPVMAIIAQFRGTTCLHGSAVSIDGGIVAFLGPGGAGKSTTATAFARAGYPVASDDLILLDSTGESFAVEPSSPVLRLWPSTVELLFGHEEAVPLLSPLWSKRGINVAQDYAFQTEPLPLRAVYVLAPRSADAAAPYFSEISGAAALITLIENSWAHYVDKPAFLAAQMGTLARLSLQVPIRRLVPHTDIARLPDLIRLITDETRRGTSNLQVLTCSERC